MAVIVLRTKEPEYLDEFEEEKTKESLRNFHEIVEKIQEIDPEAELCYFYEADGSQEMKFMEEAQGVCGDIEGPIIEYDRISDKIVMR